MSFEDQYELGALLHTGRAMTFEATETSSGRRVFVHFFLAAQPGQTDLLQQASGRVAESERSQSPNPFHLGERDGAPFVVTPAEPEFRDLEGWLQEPAPETAEEPAQSAATGLDPERGGGQPGDFTLLFEDRKSAASTEDEPPRDEASPEAEPAPLSTAEVSAHADLPAAPSEETSAFKTDKRELPDTAGPGEFTRLFQAGQAAGEASAGEMPESEETASEAEEPQREPEKPMESSGADAPPERAAPPRSTAGSEPGEFTRLFGIGSSGTQDAVDAPITPEPPEAGKPSTASGKEQSSDSSADPGREEQRTASDRLPESTEPLAAKSPATDSAPDSPARRPSSASEASPAVSRKPAGHDPGIPNIHPAGLAQPPGAPPPRERPPEESRQETPAARRPDLTVFRRVPRPGEAAPADPASGAASHQVPQPPQPAGREPSQSPARPPAPPKQEQPGEFTRLFGSSRPDPAFSDDPFRNLPAESQMENKPRRPPSEPGEFTKLFGGGARPQASQEDPLAQDLSTGSAFDSLQGDPLDTLSTNRESEQGGEFTKLFGSKSKVVEGPSPPPGDYGFFSGSPAGERASTRIFENRASAPPASQPPPAGEGDYTRIVKGGAAAAPRQSASPPQPAAPPPLQPAAPVEPPQPAQAAEVKQPEEGKEPDSSRLTYLILALVFCGLLVLALGIVLYFSSKGSESPAQATPTAGSEPAAGTAAPPAVPGVSVYSPGVSTPQATAPSVSPGSVHAPSVSSGSVNAPSVTAPSVSAPSVSSGSVTAPGATMSSPSGTSAVTGAASASSAEGSATPYLALIIALSVLLVFAVGAAVYFAAKRA